MKFGDHWSGMDLQQKINHYWETLGNKYGFKNLTVEGSSRGKLFFLAESKPIEVPKTEGEKAIDKFDTLQNEIDSTYMMLDVLSSPKEYNAEYRVIRFNKLLDNLTRDSSIFYLTSEGLSIYKQKILTQNDLSLCFILGSQHDLSDEQEKALFDIKYIPISLGQKDYLASHVITIVCNHLSHLDDN